MTTTNSNAEKPEKNTSGELLDDKWDQTTVAAHQMKSPLSTLQTIIRTLLSGYAGDLTKKQREILQGADTKCLEAMDTVRGLLSLSEARQQQPGDTIVDIVSICHQVHKKYAQQASEADIHLSVDCPENRVFVPGDDDLLTEAVTALVDNAIKYTPEGGEVRLTLSVNPDTRQASLSVEDSGIGIPEKERDELFVPFFRASNARKLHPSGTGLGLPLVKTVVENSGGRLSVEDSEIGGAKFTLSLPTREATADQAGTQDRSKEPSFRLVIIGGVAAGPKIAAKVRRMDPDAEITIVEKGQALSYAGCGLPYYISGQVKEQKELVSTPDGSTRGPEYFERIKNVRVRNNTEAIEIDRDRKRVLVSNHITGSREWLPYDKLALATGAVPIVPDIPGMRLQNVFTLHGIRNAEGIREVLSEERAKDVTIVGGGLIGIEMTESLVATGSRVTLVEMQSQFLPNLLDSDIAAMVRRHLETKGVRIMLNTKATGFSGDGRVQHVSTSSGEFPADMVIIGAGVKPNVALAQKAGLELGKTGGIAVNRHMQTSDECIYAAGDCTETINLVSGEKTYFPMGSTAVKQARVAAMNICQKDDSFPGVTGTTVCKIFDMTVARTGLTGKKAREKGYDVITALVPAMDRAHYMPEAEIIILKLVADARTMRLLGVQAIGRGETVKRVDVAVAALTGKMTLDKISKLDLGYAPSCSEALDALHTAVNVLKNKLNGQFTGIEPEEVCEKKRNGDDFLLLDVRPQRKFDETEIEGSLHIPLGTLRGRLDELPKDKEIVLFSRVSLNAYEASLILRSYGFKDVKVMEGGIIAWTCTRI